MGIWSGIDADEVFKNNVIAVDILDMDLIPGVKFIKQDFLTDNATDIIKASHSGGLSLKNLFYLSCKLPYCAVNKISKLCKI